MTKTYMADVVYSRTIIETVTVHANSEEEAVDKIKKGDVDIIDTDVEEQVLDEIDIYKD